MTTAVKVLNRPRFVCLFVVPGRVTWSGAEATVFAALVMRQVLEHGLRGVTDVERVHPGAAEPVSLVVLAYWYRSRHLTTVLVLSKLKNQTQPHRNRNATF